jgi:N-acetylneuraminate synthase/sialic acid synthase
LAGILRIGTHEIGDSTPCYVIAEIGHNHQGSLEKARELFREAKLAGAHAVKLQKRDNRRLYTRAAYDKPYDNENSFGATYGEHREFLEFGLEQYRELQRYAKELEIDFFATAFDLASADFLAALDVPAYKIASGDLKSTPLLKHVAAFGKPVIISTGGALIEDVQRAYDTIMPINPQLGILQCTAGYPAAFEELDLRVIAGYR